MPGGRKRTIADHDRDVTAVEHARRGLTYDQIAKAMGYRDKSGAYRAVQRGLRDAYREEADQLVAMEAERLNALRRTLERVAATRHYAVAPGGKIAVHPQTGEPLADDGPVLQAAIGLLKVSESWRKLKGLDAPAKHEVRTIDAIDARLLDLAGQVGPVGSADAQGVPVEA